MVAELDGVTHEDGPPALRTRTCAVAAGQGAALDALMRRVPVPMLRLRRIRVVHQQLCLDPDRYLLVRRFDGESRRTEDLTAFCGGAERLTDWDHRAIALIDNYHAIRVPLTAGTAASLADAASGGPARSG